MKSLVFFALLLVSLFSSCSSTDWVSQDDPSYPVKMARMVGRGGGNVISAPFELVSQPVRYVMDEDELGKWMSGLVHGIFVGIFYTGGRAVSGVVDLVTFFVPHKSLIEPEFLTLP